jgi:hypothetical protein
MDILENDRKFKEVLGDFLIAFTQLEFGLAELCTLTDFDLKNNDVTFEKFLGQTFEQKRKIITNFIKENFSDIQPIWDTLNEKIGQINRHRRFLIHGIVDSFIQKNTITTIIKEKGNKVQSEFSISQIKKIINEIHEINTGSNGILGEFNILFKTIIFNHWNNLEKNSNKVIFKIDQEIFTDFKG